MLLDAVIPVLMLLGRMHNCGRQTMDCTTYHGRFRSFLHHWSTSVAVESATYINSSDGLYRNIQVLFKN